MTNAQMLIILSLVATAALIYSCYEFVRSGKIELSGIRLADKSSPLRFYGVLVAYFAIAAALIAYVNL